MKQINLAASLCSFPLYYYSSMMCNESNTSSLGFTIVIESNLITTTRLSLSIKIPRALPTTVYADKFCIKKNLFMTIKGGLQATVTKTLLLLFGCVPSPSFIFWSCFEML